MDLRSGILLLVATPDRALLTLLIGALMVYRELARPGRVVPGVLGAAAVVTALWALGDYRLSAAGLGVAIVGIALVVLQAYRDRLWLFPALAGTLALTLGTRYALAPPNRISTLACLAVVPFSGITVFLLRIAVRARRIKMDVG